MNHLLSSKDISNLDAFLRITKRIKEEPLKYSKVAEDKTMVLLFFNSSLRTRLSTQKAANNLGMHVIALNVSQTWEIEFEDGSVMNLNRAEHVKEAAAVISQYADVIGVRSFAGLKDRDQDYSEVVMTQFARYSSVPILNLESATVHPLQALTDCYTIEEYKKVTRPKIVLSWAPHPRLLPQAVANSFVDFVKMTNCELVLTHPIGYELAPQFTEGCRIEYDQERAFENADFIYAKNWSSYTHYGQAYSAEEDWIINESKMEKTRDAYFMHCLPVRRNVVVSDAVLDSERSLVIKQAANREIIAQAAIYQLLQIDAK